MSAGFPEYCLPTSNSNDVLDSEKSNGTSLSLIKLELLTYSELISSTSMCKFSDDSNSLMLLPLRPIIPAMESLETYTLILESLRNSTCGLGS